MYIIKRSYSQSSENGVQLQPGLFPREASVVQKKALYTDRVRNMSTRAQRQKSPDLGAYPSLAAALRRIAVHHKNHIFLSTLLFYRFSHQNTMAPSHYWTLLPNSHFPEAGLKEALRQPRHCKNVANGK
jgi:hypothetical protein